MSSLEKRVLQLEQTNRRLARIVISMGLAFGALFIAGAQRGRAVEPLVRAQRIQLVDDQGKLFAAEHLTAADSATVAALLPSRR